MPENPYYEIGSKGKLLMMIHAQGVDALSCENVWKSLSRNYHIYAVDCLGHGGSTHDSACIMKGRKAFFHAFLKNNRISGGILNRLL